MNRAFDRIRSELGAVTQAQLSEVLGINQASVSIAKRSGDTVGKRLAEQKVNTPITESALVPMKEQAIKAAMPENLREKVFDFKIIEDDFINGLKDAERIPLSSPVFADA
ncbi:hypothetical protein [Oleidesulfovibrio sp.]|uniref:hypothetical protein n=1 Tax=Oleidesulfovibrio sp. TaxID=2909707 RepID=UPI003A8A321D